MTKFEIARKSKKYREIQAMIKELEGEAEMIKTELTTLMEAMDIDVIEADIFTVRWTPYTSNRVDTNALRKELPDIAARYMVTSKTKRFQIA